MACITEAAIGFPNASGTIPPENGMLPEILAERGWNTYLVGKWHLCPTDEMHLAATRRNWPSGRGFERFYGFLGAETNQWYPDLVYDNHPVDQPRSPEEGYHLTDDITDKALEFIKDAKAVAPDKPFFLYYAPGACHAPHHAPTEWIDQFRGQFDMGYEAIREQTLARQKDMGIVPPDTELPPLNPIGTPESRTGPDGKPFPELDYTRPWDSLSDDEKRLFARMAEVYAGFLAHADHHIGRLLDYLEQTGQRDNTLVILVSDNGASGEGGPNGSVNEMKFANGVADDMAENLAKLDDLGGPRTYNHYPNGWAMAFNTPFKMWKRYEFNGGTADPCIISWPKGMQGPGRDPATSTTTRSTSCRRSSTSLGVDPPETIKGHTQSPLRRRQHARQHRRRVRDIEPQDPVLRDARLPRRSGTRAGRPSPRTRASPAGATSTTTPGSCTTPTSTGPSCTTSPTEHPDKLRELVALWFAEAGANGAFPLDDRSAVEILHDPASAAHRAARRGTSYYPGTAPVPEWQAVSTRNRSFVIGALVDIRDPRAEGVLFAMGSRFGGHALYVKDNRLHYVNNFLGSEEQKIVGTEDIPTGKNLILSASFEKEEQRPDCADRNPVALPRRPQGRRGQDQDPARRVRHRRLRPVRGPGPAASRSPTTTRASRRTRSPAAPSTGSRSTSAATRTWTSSARRNSC